MNEIDYVARKRNMKYILNFDLESNERPIRIKTISLIISFLQTSIIHSSRNYSFLSTEPQTERMEEQLTQAYVKDDEKNKVTRHRLITYDML
jgi:hypothetical protein